MYYLSLEQLHQNWLHLLKERELFWGNCRDGFRSGSSLDLLNRLLGSQLDVELPNGFILDPGLLRGIGYTAFARKVKPRCWTRGHEVHLAEQSHKH